VKIKIYNFKQIGDERGTLVPIEADKDIPFSIKRVYYMYGTGKGVRRGLHAHKTLQQTLICIHGSCKILLDDGTVRKVVELDQPHQGLHIGKNMWREMFDFSDDAVLMVLASEYYNEDDYVRDYDEFVRFIKEGLEG